jgi:hypothetical protein
MPTRAIMFSVAHSSAARGARAQKIALDEYAVSRRASEAAFDVLAGDHACMLFDVGPFGVSGYDDAKVAAVNGLMPRLAVEIHCNASNNAGANYGEVIHHKLSEPGAQAAAVIARTLSEGFRDSTHKIWRNRGARPNTVEQDGHKMFFLERTKAPAIIVEGLFISNEEQAAWLATGGDVVYGLLVAEGIKRWLGGARE